MSRAARIRTTMRMKGSPRRFQGVVEEGTGEEGREWERERGRGEGAMKMAVEEEEEGEEEGHWMMDIIRLVIRLSGIGVDGGTAMVLILLHR